MRPGEKLYEELFFGPEVTMPTGHPKVLRARQPVLPMGLSGVVSELVDAAQRGAADDHLRELLSRLVPDYQPGVLDAELPRAASLAPRSR